MSKNLRLSGQIISGLIIILVGVLFLLGTTGWYDTSTLWKYFPSIFILIGIYSLIRNKLRNIAGPILLISIATLFQLLALNLVTGDTLAKWWPIFIIIIGIVIVIKRFEKPSRKISKNQINLFALLGGNEGRSISKSFKGGDLTAILGGIEIDLRDAEISKEPAIIHATAILGGIDIKLPRDWNVQNNILPILGGAEDKRRTTTGKGETDLIIEGFAFLGGISLKD
ncbi:MAG: putative membrane protein [Candidatus Methanohalarchaeum thermophilum]|uniref:Membrane protein n=1 Tax=Methanohalarchaeum thermophilum TaxID=1903181 RepID=A0A1Q6DSB9_METT1|nr:MAG: putative membrane protein [Candidatus Methanohalarchaeum thermophilum]